MVTDIRSRDLQDMAQLHSCRDPLDMEIIDYFLARSIHALIIPISAIYANIYLRYSGLTQALIQVIILD